MMKRIALSLALIGGISLISACSGNKKSLGEALNTNDLVASYEVESLPKTVGVYNAMARAAKYNSDVAAQNTLKKMYNGDENPQKIADNMVANVSSPDKLINAVKAMDFADLYAMSVLTDNQKYIEDTLYAKSAQNLSVEVIRLHREEIFAANKIKEIDRTINRYGKILKNLNDRMNKDASLTADELNYRKNLELVVSQFAEIKNQLAMVRREYIDLIKAKGKELRLEGKRFYELEDFDKKYTPDIFQDSAVSNRREFSLARDELGSFNAAKARRQAYVDYPLVARLDVNGLKIEDSRYEKELFEKAKRVTSNLLSAVENYQKKPSNERLKQKVFDELAALVITQVEVVYRLVEKATLEYEANSYKLAETKKVINAMREKGASAYWEKIDLMNKEIELLTLEQNEARLLAQRAANLRNLYFMAGLTPFDKNILRSKIRDIETVLKQAFNHDLVTMLSAIKDNPKWDDGGNAWAHKDNWLEELLDNEKKVKKTTKPKAKKVIEKASHHTVMQFGAFTDVDNATAEQMLIKKSVPSLNGYDMYIEQAVVNGTTYHRLMLKPEADKLQKLCKDVIDAGFDCILK
ncbi:MAG: hypothetical protein E7004_06245 [Alphaproteobacteria bacterium]|nr:hypothetical protein [Alphaproteobacteria bacterium]